MVRRWGVARSRSSRVRAGVAGRSAAGAECHDLHALCPALMCCVGSALPVGMPASHPPLGTEEPGKSGKDAGHRKASLGPAPVASPSLSPHQSGNSPTKEDGIWAHERPRERARALSRAPTLCAKSCAGRESSGAGSRGDPTHSVEVLLLQSFWDRTQTLTA